MRKDIMNEERLSLSQVKSRASRRRSWHGPRSFDYAEFFACQFERERERAPFFDLNHLTDIIYTFGDIAVVF